MEIMAVSWKYQPWIDGWMNWSNDRFHFLRQSVEIIIQIDGFGISLQIQNDRHDVSLRIVLHLSFVDKHFVVDGFKIQFAIFKCGIFSQCHQIAKRF